jgi:general secretion pathway protein G
MKTREGGFTLVELLIVIMIIATLAGMMLLATGVSMDSTEAAKVIGDIRGLKSAALLFYGDNLRWPDATETKSLDLYADRAVDTGRYNVTIGDSYYVDGVRRTNIGVVLVGANNSTPGVKNKLASKAKDVGLFKTADTATEYDGGTAVYMNMR